MFSILCVIIRCLRSGCLKELGHSRKCLLFATFDLVPKNFRISNKENSSFSRILDFSYQNLEEYQFLQDSRLLLSKPRGISDFSTFSRIPAKIHEILKKDLSNSCEVNDVLRIRFPESRRYFLEECIRPTVIIRQD